MSKPPMLSVCVMPPGWGSRYRDVCTVHRLITECVDDGARRVLWAVPREDRLLIQHGSPLRAPREAMHVDTAPTMVEFAAGQRVQWAWIANPVMVSATSRKRTAAPDVAAWATTRLDRWLADVDVTVAARWTASGSHRHGRVVHRVARLVGSGIVTDPGGLADAVRSGVGRGRAHGCGLLMVEQS